MARRQAAGGKYALRLDQSVSGDLQKLRDRLAVAKAEISAIRADVVTVTSPVRRPPVVAAVLSRTTALTAEPKPKPFPAETAAKLEPPPAQHRAPVYSLRQAPTVRLPAIRNAPGPGVPTTAATTTGRKLAMEKTISVSIND